MGEVDKSVAFPLLQHRGAHHADGGFVRALGLVASTFGAVQIDLNVVHRTDDSTEITLCDHNCTTTVDGIPSGGSYTCPAAMSLNRGARQTSPASAAELTKGLRTTIAGLREAQRVFLAEDLDAYLVREGIPFDLHADFRAALGAQGVVVNLFGGSPETHPQIIEIIECLHEMGAEVHMTTTGRRIIRDADFRAAFLRHPTDVIGLGADDFESVEDVDYLFGLSFDELSTLWRKVPWQYGQRRKAIEAVQICKLAECVELPRLLFNIVLHPGNLAIARDLHDRLAHHVPTAVLNPYPVQTAFLSKRGELMPEHLAALRNFADAAIEVHAVRAAGGDARWNLAPRIGYWMLMKALLGTDQSDAETSDEIGGDGVWRCYTARGAGRCVQIGIAAGGAGATEIPGGHLGCFWNTGTITDDRQFWEITPAEAADWVLDGRQRAAASARTACRGCLFPRMSMDAVSLELGLTPDVLHRYRRARRQYVGY
jgi:hypothetical protein